MIVRKLQVYKRLIKAAGFKIVRTKWHQKKGDLAYHLASFVLQQSLN